jgi:hypothetical protein
MKTNTKRQQLMRKKRFIAVSIVVAIVLLFSAGAYAILVHNNPSKDSDTTTDTEQESINYDPPTEQEVEDSQDGKDNLDNDRPTTEAVAVGVTFAGVVSNQVEIRAFIPGVIQGTGTCTVTLTKGSLKVESSSEAFIDASSSQCRPIYIPTSNFPESGTWKFTVSYKSPDHYGMSAELEVTL